MHQVLTALAGNPAVITVIVGVVGRRPWRRLRGGRPSPAAAADTSFTVDSARAGHR
jgi:hypothetical protein